MRRLRRLSRSAYCLCHTFHVTFNLRELLTLFLNLLSSPPLLLAQALLGLLLLSSSPCLHHPPLCSHCIESMV